MKEIQKHLIFKFAARQIEYINSTPPIHNGIRGVLRVLNFLGGLQLGCFYLFKKETEFFSFSLAKHMKKWSGKKYPEEEPADGLLVVLREDLLAGQELLKKIAHFEVQDNREIERAIEFCLALADFAEEERQKF